MISHELVFFIHKFIAGQIGPLRERTGFRIGMDFVCDIYYGVRLDHLDVVVGGVYM